MNTKNSPILVVEDDHIFREVLSEGLKAHGFETIEAGEGDAASEMIKGQKLGLVLADIRMPGKDGLTLLNEIKHIQKLDTPVILMSGFSDLPIQQIYNLGASGLLQKPFKPEQVFEALQNVLVPREVRWQQLSNPELYETNMFFEWDTYVSAKKSKLLNLGRGGFFTATNATPPPVGTRIHFEIEYRDNPKYNIQGLGIIRWIRETAGAQGPRGCGVEFVHLGGTSYENVLKLTSTLEDPAYIPQR